MRRLVLPVATVGGIGYVPGAPGTAASLLVLPVLPWLVGLRDRAPGSFIVLVGVVIVLAIWASSQAERVLGRHDDGCVVIDEVAGMVTAACFVPASWGAALLTFATFRLFDIWKPQPIGLLDRTVGGGVGVVIDDVVAGVYAGLLTLLLLWLV